MKMLELIDVHTYYGESHILDGICFEVMKGSVVALLGRNGMGKTTVAHSIIGFTPPRDGVIRLKGQEISGLPSHKISKAGVAFVPQGRRIFPSLTVKENLTIGMRNTERKGSWTLRRVYSVFPFLEKRAGSLGTLLSGGEQQMLCIARALLTNPDLLLVDEPSEGLTPLIVRSVSDIISKLREEGNSILMVESNLPLALGISDYVYILSKGEIVYHGTPAELDEDIDIQTRHLAV